MQSFNLLSVGGSNRWPVQVSFVLLPILQKVLPKRNGPIRPLQRQLAHALFPCFSLHPLLKLVQSPFYRHFNVIFHNFSGLWTDLPLKMPIIFQKLQKKENEDKCIIKSRNKWQLQKKINLLETPWLLHSTNPGDVLRYRYKCNAQEATSPES